MQCQRVLIVEDERDIASLIKATLERGGTIEAEGSHGLTEGYTLAVVGGTGSYAGAGGTLQVSPGKGQTENVVVSLD